MRRLLKAACLCLAVLSLCGCGRMEPEKEVDLSGFDPASVRLMAAGEREKAHRIIRSETFQNADGSAEYYVNFNNMFTMEPLPVVEAEPYYLTAEDARKTIESFFPDGKFYEKHPKYMSPETYWTKDKLAKNLKRWKSFDLADVERICGYSYTRDENGEVIPFETRWQEDLRYYEELLERVPEEDMRTPCLWKMFKETEYMVEPSEAERMDLSYDADCIMVSVEDGERRYGFVALADKYEPPYSTLFSLYRVTMSSPHDIEWNLFVQENQTMPRPTQKQKENAQKEAQRYADMFPVGKWKVGEPEHSSWDSTIYFKAYPVDPPMPAGKPVTVNAVSREIPEMSIRMHPDGSLMDFWVGRKLAKTMPQAAGAVELPLETLVDNVLDSLKTGEEAAYGVAPVNLLLFEAHREELDCRVEVTRAAREYAQIDAVGGGVCYVPCLCLYGTAEYTGKDSGTVYTKEELKLAAEGEIPLVAVNAIDGSIIPVLWNGD